MPSDNCPALLAHYGLATDLVIQRMPDCEIADLVASELAIATASRRDAVPSRVRGDPMRYFAAAVLRRAATQPSATARLGSACPGKVAHPVFITNSV